MEENKKSNTYTIVPWEIDATGRLLSDEMFRMSSFIGDDKFDTYIMPHRDITIFASRRYQVVTVSSGLYRYLKRKNTATILRSKTEYIALEEFLEFLSKHPNDKKIALMCYEPFELAPFIMIQALKRYDMFQRFKELVHGFVHVYDFVKKKCKKSMTSLSLRPLAKVLLNRNDVRIYDSLNRVMLVQEILLHLCVGDSNNPAETLDSELQHYVKSVDDLESELDVRMKRIEAQISLRPIFMPYLKLPESRKKAVVIRSQLTRHQIDYKTLEELWGQGRDSFKDELLKKLEAVGDDIKNGLLAVLEHYFSTREQHRANSTVPLNIEDLLKNISLKN